MEYSDLSFFRDDQCLGKRHVDSQLWVWRLIFRPHPTNPTKTKDDERMTTDDDDDDDEGR